MSPTKKQMVDFIMRGAKANNVKIPRSTLSSKPEETLMQMISQNEELLKMFEKYVERDNTKVVVSRGIQKAETVRSELHCSVEALEHEFEYLVDRLFHNPTSFLGTIRFTEFMNRIPHNVLSVESLARAEKKLFETKVNMPCISLLMDYRLGKTAADPNFHSVFNHR